MRPNVEEDFGNPYSPNQSWEPSFFRLQDVQAFKSLPWDDRLPDVPEGFIGKSLCDIGDNESNAFRLNGFNYTLESIDATAEVPLPSSEPESETNEQNSPGISSPDEDVWLLSEIPNPALEKKPLKSWDNLTNHRLDDNRPIYLSEAGNEAYDAFLAYKSGGGNSGRVSESAIFNSCLCLAQIGCNSILFYFDEKSSKFIKSADDARISGVSLPTITSSVEDILSCGTHMRQIERSIRSMLTDTDKPIPFAGLAHAASLLHNSLQLQLSRIHAQGPSLLKLSLLSRRLIALLESVTGIIDSCRYSMSDGEAVTAIFKSCAFFANQYTWLSGIFHEIMTLVTNHWFSLVESWIGLRPDPYTFIELDCNGKGFIRVAYTSRPDSKGLQQRVVEFDYHPEAMPEFLPQEYRDQIFESGKSLRMLKTYHPHHPLVRRAGRSRFSALSLRLAVDWEDIERIQNRASDYERELRYKILNYYREINTSATWSTKGSDDNEAETTEEPSPIKDTFELFDIDKASITEDGLPTQQSILSSRLHALVEESGTVNLDVPLEGRHTFGPPLSSSVYYSFAPVISAQTRMINYSCLQLLFQGHHIRSHLDVQWRFQLLCDGVFSSQLSLVLFDPDMHSGERKRNVATAGVSTGLRLGSRETWPPATSEIRLVLMGLLSDCYHGSGKRDNLSGGAKTDDEELPGGLSFAIRQLNNDDLRKFRDPDSVEALDFLRLIYTPPPVLENVITQKALDGYDSIFKHLLRLTRLLTVVRNLARHSTARRTSCNEWTTRLHLFRMEALHFIETLAEYIFQFGIGRSWQKFNEILEKIERGLSKGDVDQTLAYSRSLRHLREHHEAILDRMQSALLLSKPHAHAMKVLEDIFGTILLFSPVSKTLARATDDDDLDFSALAKRISQLHINFRRQTHEFVQYLREICGTAIAESSEQLTDLGSWAADQQNVDDTGMLTHLLLRLDFNQYY